MYMYSLGIMLGIFILCIFIFLLLVYQLIKQFINNSINQSLLKSFTNDISVLEYFLSKAYNIIYKDKLIIYSIEGMKSDDITYESCTSDFVKLTIKLMGPVIFDYFVKLFGNEDTLYFYCMEYFDSSYENDEIRKASLDSLSEKDIDEE